MPVICARMKAEISALNAVWRTNVSKNLMLSCQLRPLANFFLICFSPFLAQRLIYSGTKWLQIFLWIEFSSTFCQILIFCKRFESQDECRSFFPFNVFQEKIKDQNWNFFLKKVSFFYLFLELLNQYRNLFKKLWAE